MTPYYEDLTAEVWVHGKPSRKSSGASKKWRREVRCPITGRMYVAARPGARKVTSEEIHALPREGDEFP